MAACIASQHATKRAEANVTRTPFTDPPPMLFRSADSCARTSSQTLNQVVVWDQIISEPAHAWIRSSSVANKYSLTDQGYGLKSNNVTLVVNWNTVPSTGLLTLHHSYSSVHTFDVPEEYSS